jgi:hypothetical protein
MSETTSVLTDQYILFFDFLGTSAAAKGWPPDRLNEFVRLLDWISKRRTPASISGHAREDGSYSIRITPETSTFSDHVVITYTAADAGGSGKMLESVWTEIVFMDCIRILGEVAEGAMNVGLLIRGGLSFGQLYHKDGVVFGEAMIDAYGLENDAVYPKVAISHRVMEKLTHEQPTNLRSLLIQDQDTTWHLNYFRGMVAAARVPDGQDQFSFAQNWRKGRLKQIDDTIANLAPGKAANKWAWFKKHFEEETARFAEQDQRQWEPVGWQPSETTMG